MNTINLRLRHLRRQRNMSQEELAQKLGVSRQAIIALEQGASLPSLPVMMAILRVLDIPFDSLFNPVWTPFRSLESNGAAALHLTVFQERETIPVHITENDQNIVILAELPGVKEENVTVDMSSQHVLIMATKPMRDAEAESVTHTREVHYGAMTRILSLPAPIDTSQAQAEFQRGVLQLTLPKFLPETKRRITFRGEERGVRGEKEDHGSE